MYGESYPAAAQSSCPPTMAVIGQQYCLSYPVDLTIVRKMLTLSKGNFEVKDANGNLMFKVNGKLFCLHDQHTLVDAAGKTIVTFRRKIFSAHGRWQVFRGESTKPNDLLFSVKRSSILQMKTKLHVFLASNTAEELCDFKIESSWFERSCVVYSRNSNNIIAQMKKNCNARCILMGKDLFGVTVCPNIDYAFVVVLVVLLEEINTVRPGNSGGP
ncbi:Protein LURP-one-related 15 [Striga hermonthica]|uniref:Protein LURP-one-related 15 n=1 Tax=Striga hermonthica TaxID=68872 RepID=A0A9N7RI78_STRHE|nr:Protein LURP-one-related 15 [Striga hermonthica]